MHNIVQVHVHVKPECVDAFIAASRENARQSRLEPGIARFEVYQQKDDLTRFVFLEAFLTSEAAAAHRASVHYKIWRDTVAEMMAEPRRGVNLAEV